MPFKPLPYCYFLAVGEGADEYEGRTFTCITEGQLTWEQIEATFRGLVRQQTGDPSNATLTRVFKSDLPIKETS